MNEGENLIISHQIKDKNLLTQKYWGYGNKNISK